MNKKIALAVVIGGLFFFVSSMMSQNPIDSRIHEAGERRKLASFLGEWTAEGDFKPSETSSGGKSKWKETCAWFEGNYAVICHSEGEFGGHLFKEISVMAYDATKESYIYFETNDKNESDLWLGKVEADTWTWSEKGMTNGKPSQTRFTQRFSGNTIRFSLESAIGDTPFKMVMDGKQTRKR